MATVRTGALIEEPADEFLSSSGATSKQPRYLSSSSRYAGRTLTRQDVPPWPLDPAAPDINAQGTNHREVVTPSSLDTDPPRLWAWLPMPAREAPAGSELARKRAASRSRSKVPCQTTYAKRKYGGNSRLDRLMDMGVCWHYNAEVARERSTAATMRRPDGKRGALAWYDDEGRLRWLDRYGQTRPRFTPEGEPSFWDPCGYGKPVDQYTRMESAACPVDTGGSEVDRREIEDEGGTVPERGSMGGTGTDTAETVDEDESTVETTTNDPGRTADDVPDEDIAPSGGGSGGASGGQTPDASTSSGDGAAEGVEVPDWLVLAGGAALLWGAWWAFGGKRKGSS